MKKAIMIGLLAVMSAGCASQTDFGKCIGINGKEDPTLEYEWSARNIIVGAIFIELLAPPIIVILKECKCPIAKKGA